MRARAFGAALALATTVAQAQSPETLVWLRKMYDATQRLSYTGTFVYQNDGRTETSRITRYVDPAGDIDRSGEEVAAGEADASVPAEQAKRAHGGGEDEREPSAAQGALAGRARRIGPARGGTGRGL